MKRTCAMMLRFHRSELDALTKKARKARMSRDGTGDAGAGCGSIA